MRRSVEQFELQPLARSARLGRGFEVRADSFCKSVSTFLHILIIYIILISTGKIRIELFKYDVSDEYLRGELRQ